MAAALLVATGAAPGPALSQVPAPPPALSSAPPVAGVLSFEAALALALERNPAILAARGSRDIAAAQLRGARAWENPTLEIEAENVLGRGAYADFDAAETTVSLSQQLPLGGTRAAAVRGARAGEQRAAADADLARIEVRRDLRVAYADAITADRLAAIERERARIGAATRAAVEQRFAAGLESELQRARIEVETSGLQAAARRASAEAQLRRRALAALWREDAVSAPLDEAWFDALEGTDVAGVGTAVVATASTLSSGSVAPAEHPRLRAARFEVARARSALDAARAQRFAGVEARVGTRRFADQPGDSGQAFVIGLAMPLPLWDRNGAGIAVARAALVTAEIQAETTGRELQGAQLLATASLEAAAMEARALVGSGLPAAQAAARLAQQGYDAGRLSLLERLAAERALTEVRERLEFARRELHHATAMLESLQAP